MRIQDLTAQSILTQSGMSRAVERLEKAGLVTRESASEDRRGAYAVLTMAGLERFNAAIQGMSPSCGSIFCATSTRLNYNKWPSSGIDWKPARIKPLVAPQRV